MRPMLKFLPSFSSSSLVRTSHWKIYDPFQYTSLHGSFASLVAPTKSKPWLMSKVFIQGYSRRRFTCLPTFITLFPFSLHSLIMVRSFVLSVFHPCFWLPTFSVNLSSQNQLSLFPHALQLMASNMTLQWAPTWCSAPYPRVDKISIPSMR
jgi:hypothetical protein